MFTFCPFDYTVNAENLKENIYSVKVSALLWVFVRLVFCNFVAVCVQYFNSAFALLICNNYFYLICSQFLILVIA